MKMLWQPGSSAVKAPGGALSAVLTRVNESLFLAALFQAYRRALMVASGRGCLGH